MLPHQVIGEANGWAKGNVSLSLLRCASSAAVLQSLGDCCFGMMVPGWYVVHLCGWPSWLQRSKYSEVFTSQQKVLPRKIFNLFPKENPFWLAKEASSTASAGMIFRGFCQHLCLHRCTQQTPCCEAGFTVVDHQTCCRVDSAAIGFAPWSNRKRLQDNEVCHGWLLTLSLYHVFHVFCLMSFFCGVSLLGLVFGETWTDLVEARFRCDNGKGKRLSSKYSSSMGFSRFAKCPLQG